MTTSAIFLPVFLQMAITFLLYFLTYRVRVGLVKSGQAKASDFRTYENEPPESRKWGRAISNQFETPVIFYALCVVAYITANTDTVTQVLAWAYSLIKAIHVYLHVSGNRLRYRQPAFGLALLVLIALFLWLAFRLVTV